MIGIVYRLGACINRSMQSCNCSTCIVQVVSRLTTASGITPGSDLREFFQTNISANVKMQTKDSRSLNIRERHTHSSSTSFCFKSRWFSLFSLAFALICFFHYQYITFLFYLLYRQLDCSPHKSYIVELI